MPLVDYDSSSGSDSGSKQPHRNALPPLPHSFHDLYPTASRTATTDDPTLHSGRRRAVPHVEGNYPTHIYLEWRPLPHIAACLMNLLDAISATLPPGTVHQSLISDLGAPTPLHISLSAPLVLRSEQREDFAAAITACVRGVGTVRVRLGGLRWVANTDETRWFLAMVARCEGDNLKSLLNGCNEVATKWGLERLYCGQNLEECFHFSIGWTLMEPRKHSEKSIALPEELQHTWLDFDKVKLKVGNVVSSLPVGYDHADKGGILS